MLIKTYFDIGGQKNFLQSFMSFMEHSKQHLSNICGSMEFHGT